MNRLIVVIITTLFSTVCMADDDAALKNEISEKYPGFTFFEETFPKIMSNASNFVYDDSSFISANPGEPVNYRTPQINFRDEALVNGLLSKGAVNTSAGSVLRIENAKCIVFINPVLKTSNRWQLNLPISGANYKSEWTVEEGVELLEKHYALVPNPPKLIDPVRTQAFVLQSNSVRELAVQVAKRLFPEKKWIRFATVDHTVKADGTLQGTGKIPWNMY